MPAFGGTARRIADDAYDPSWSPDGRRIAFRSARDGSWRLYVVSLDDGIVSRVEGAEPTVAGVAWSPDSANPLIAYVASATPATGWDLYAISPEGDSIATQLTTDSAAVALGPAWAPDGSWICKDFLPVATKVLQEWRLEGLREFT